MNISNHAWAIQEHAPENVSVRLIKILIACPSCITTYIHLDIFKYFGLMYVTNIYQSSNNDILSNNDSTHVYLVIHFRLPSPDQPNVAYYTTRVCAI